MNSAKIKPQNKTSVNVSRKAKLVEKSVSGKKFISLKSVKLPLKTEEVSKKAAPKIQKAKSTNSVKAIKVNKTLSSKITENKTSKTKIIKLSIPQRDDKKSISKKTENTDTKKNNAVSKTNLKTQISKTVEPKDQQIKVASAKNHSKATLKTELKPIKSKPQKPGEIKLKTNVAKSKVQESKVSKTVPRKSLTAKSNSPKSEKSVINKIVLKVVEKNKADSKKSAAKSVSNPRVRETQVSIKPVGQIVKPKIKLKKSLAKSERKNVLAYAKPAITGKVKLKQIIPAMKEIGTQKIEQEIQNIEKPKRKSIRAIGQAIFRGERDFYQFKVYEINENLKEIPAVYIISKRITDKKNRGHHKLICIGQTDSVIKDLKTHRKNKCLRANKANVISILQEDDKEKRLQIETDLKAAHSIVCNLKR